MSSDIVGAMKPQDQIIYMLGQIQGELKAVHATVEAQNTRQATINATTTAELSKLSDKVETHGEQLAVLDSRPRLTWPQIIAGVASIAALVVTAGLLFPQLGQ